MVLVSTLSLPTEGVQALTVTLRFMSLCVRKSSYQVLVLQNSSRKVSMWTPRVNCVMGTGGMLH